jgi:hypothetical protein
MFNHYSRKRRLRVALAKNTNFCFEDSHEAAQAILKDIVGSKYEITLVKPIENYENAYGKSSYFTFEIELRPSISNIEIKRFYESCFSRRYFQVRVSDHPKTSVLSSGVDINFISEYNFSGVVRQVRSRYDDFIVRVEEALLFRDTHQEGLIKARQLKKTEFRTFYSLNKGILDLYKVPRSLEEFNYSYFNTLMTDLLETSTQEIERQLLKPLKRIRDTYR